MDSKSISSATSVEVNSDVNSVFTNKISESDSQEDVTSNSCSKPVEIPNHQNHILLLDEDHFSVNSDVDYLNDIEYSNLKRDEKIELTITKYRRQLESLETGNLNPNDKDEKKRQLVKKICDLKIKLVKLQEEAEFNNLKVDVQSQVDDLKDELSDDNPIFFKRIYSFSKSIGGHKLVLSSDVFENEKRLRTTWKNYVKNSSPLSLSPPSSASEMLNNSLPISRLLNLLTSNHLSYLTSSCVNWPMAACHPPTNPMQQLVCDHCCKKSTKSLNDYIFDALKFGKKEDSTPAISMQSSTDLRSSNPYLVCIYCFFTIHFNCLTKDVRKCPKLFFDSMNDDVIEEFYSRLYNYNTSPSSSSSSSYSSFETKKSNGNSSNNDQTKSTPVNGIIESYQKRMKRIILKICPEIGLANQDFRCAECRISISPSPAKDAAKIISKPRLCDYSGLYFCETCHMGDIAIIPARVIHNWDFQPQPVARVSLQIISYLRNKSFHYDRTVLINLVEINPMLYGLVDELIQIKRLRTELCHIYKYIWLCKQPSKPRQWISIMCQLGSYLLNEQEINYLSFCDICDLKSLVGNLSELEHLFITHITTCEGCRGKGFYCELCPNKEDILFPFSPNTTICPICNAVYHKNCYYRRNRLCPRCNRIKGKNMVKFDGVKNGEINQDNETFEAT